MEDTIASRPGRTPMPTTRPPRLPLLLFAFFLFPFLLASSPPDDPEDLVRRANAAVTRGDAEAAEKLYDPNEPPPEERDPPAPPPGGEQPGASEPGPGADAANAAQPAPQQSPVPHPRTGPKPTEAKAAGNNQNLEVLKDQDQVQPLSPEDTREYLRRTAERLERQRRDLLRTLYGPDRPGVRDW